MGINVSLPELNAGVTSLRARHDEAQSALSGADNAIAAFEGEGKLSGKAFSSLKKYFSLGYGPILEGAAQAAAELDSLNRSLPERFSQFVPDSYGLETDTDWLEEKISSVKSELQTLSGKLSDAERNLQLSLLGTLVSPLGLLATSYYTYRIYNLRSSISYDEKLLKKLDLVLDGILRFDAAQSGTYESVRQSIRQLQSKKEALLLQMLNCLSGIPQARNTSNDGICTSVAVTMLLQRKLFLDFGYAYDNFTLDEIRANLGSKYVKSIKKSNGLYMRVYSGASFSFNNGKKGWTHTFENGEKVNYQLTSAKHSKKEIKKQLQEHPEGVVVYVNYSGKKSHAIVISRYDEKTGKFYVYDGAGTGSMNDSRTREIELKDCWLYKQCGKNEDTFFGRISSAYVVK